MKADQERVKTLLADTVTLLCKNGLFFTKQLKVQGLLGITVDDDEVFIVHIDELFRDSVASQSNLPSAAISNCITTESVDGHGPVPMENLANDSIYESSSKLANSPSLKRRLPEQSQSESVKSRDDVNSSLTEPPSKRYIVENRTEESDQHIEKPKQEKDDRTLDDKTNIIVIKEETEGDFAPLLDAANPVPCDQKTLSNSPEFLQQLFNQFEQTTNEEFTGFDVDAYALQSQPTNDCSPVISTGLHLSTKPEATSLASDALNAWNSSYQPRRLSQGHMDIHSDTQVSSQFDNSDVYILPNFCLNSRRTTATTAATSIRRKRYECTLDSCGRQYQNTFDLYRHQRQKHNVPAEFFQQGRKHTFGIREIDPS